MIDREQAVPACLDKGIELPRTRLDGISKPMLAFAHSDEGVPLDVTNERAELVSLLLTPTSATRMQLRLLADLGGCSTAST